MTAEADYIEFVRARLLVVPNYLHLNKDERVRLLSHRIILEPWDHELEPPRLVFTLHPYHADLTRALPAIFSSLVQYDGNGSQMMDFVISTVTDRTYFELLERL